ncbi:hypothetical protein [Bacillus phage YungSlug]|nr:hypothetical protein [Bacillus phage YungSlug]
MDASAKHKELSQRVEEYLNFACRRCRLPAGVHKDTKNPFCNACDADVVLKALGLELSRNMHDMRVERFMKEQEEK